MFLKKYDVDNVDYIVFPGSKVSVTACNRIRIKRYPLDTWNINYG